MSAYDPARGFAQLRSTLNGPFVSSEALGRIYKLARLQHAHDLDVYRAQWVPYMMGFPAYWGYTMTTLRSMDELQEAHHVLPFARFALNLNGVGPIEQWFHTLVSSPAVACVRELDLSHERMTLAQLEELLSTPYLSGLESLNLWNHALGTPGAELLANAHHLRALTTLEVGRNTLLGQGAMALARSPNLGQLVRLGIAQNVIHDQGAMAIARTEQLLMLRHLDLSYNSIGARGATAFAQAPRSRHLKSLALRGNQLGKRGEHALATSRHLSKEIRSKWAPEG